MVSVFRLLSFFNGDARGVGSREKKGLLSGGCHADVERNSSAIHEVFDVNVSRSRLGVSYEVGPFF